MPGSSADGWREVELGEIAEVRLGRQRSPKNHTGDHMRPYLRAANVTWSGLDLSDVKQMNFTPTETETYELRPGDIVMSEASGSIGEAGKPAIWRGEIAGCCLQNTLIRIRPSERVTTEFLYYRLYLQALSGEWARSVARGVGIHHLGAQRVSAWRFLLPDLREQRSIVRDIDRRTSRVRAGISNLQRARRQIPIAEHAVVMAGVTGRLVRPLSGDHDVRTYLKESLGGALEGLEGDLDLGGLPSLPPHWQWVPLEAIASIAGGVTKDTKRQGAPEFVEVPYLRVANVQRGYLDLTDVSSIRVPPARARALALEPGDVLFNEGGDRDKLGRGWVWEGQIDRCIHQNHVFRARLRPGTLSPRLLSWFGNSAARTWFEARGRQTTNLASINLRTLKSLPVPVPPPAEQMAIEAELDRRLSLFRAAETEVKRSEGSAQRLTTAILRQAVGDRPGRLVAVRADGPAINDRKEHP